MFKHTVGVFSMLAVFLLTTSSVYAKRIHFTNGGAPEAKVDSFIIQPNGRTAVPSVGVKLSLSGLDIERRADGFDDVKVSGLTVMGEEGRPSLPATGVLLAIPNGYDPKVSIVKREQRNVPNVSVAPYQVRYRCSTPANRSFTFDSALYRSDMSFPLLEVEIKEIGKLQGLRLARLVINPILMNMATNSLNVNVEFEVKVDFEPNGEKIEPALLSDSFYSLARSLTANGKSLPDAMVRSEAPETMMIIAADDLASELTPLIEWKKAKGLNVELVTLTEAGGDKEAVKQYIQNYYDSNPGSLSYLVFVGDEDSMPPFFQSTGAGSAASDYPFALLSGDDDIPDALYGRIVAGDIDTLKLQMSRWIDYEKNPEKGASWYADGITIASNEGTYPSDEDYAEMVADALKAFTYQNIDAYVQSREDTNSRAAAIEDIVASVNAGSSWVAYFGHGSGTSWGSVDGSFSNSTVATLTNTGKLPVIIDVACLNASYASYYDTCFGEAWVNHQVDGQNAGAAAFYGGSVSISWDPPAVMSVGIAKYHFEKKLHSLGASVLAGQLYLIEQMGLGSGIIDNLEWYNLFGDPSALVRTDVPLAYTVSSAAKEVEGRKELTVKATDMDGAGVDGLHVSLTNPDTLELIAVGNTSADGEVLLTVPMGQAGIKLTVTGYNAESFEALLN